MGDSLLSGPAVTQGIDAVPADRRVIYGLYHNDRGRVPQAPP